MNSTSESNVTGTDQPSRRTVYRICDGVQVEREPDGRYRLEVPGVSRQARLHPPALAPLLMVDGWRSEEEIERFLAEDGNVLPPGTVSGVLRGLTKAGVLVETQTDWRALESRSWPAHRCQACGASCQGHWIGPVADDFMAMTIERMPALRTKYPQLEDQKPFMRLSPGDTALYLNSDSGQCLFLDDELKCILHREYGPDGKPTICCQFPHTRFEDNKSTRIGVGLNCLKHFEQILQGDENAPSEHWVTLNGETDGHLFHYYPAGQHASLEERLLKEIAGAQDPVRVMLQAVLPNKRRGGRFKTQERLAHLAEKHLKRLEADLRDDPVIDQLDGKPGLFPERLGQIRRFARGETQCGRLSPKTIHRRLSNLQKALEDTVVRFLYFRHYLMFVNMSHAVVSFVLGLWVGLALTDESEDDRADYRLGELIATWMRALQSPSVRRSMFRGQKEVDELLNVFDRLWREVRE